MSNERDEQILSLIERLSNDIALAQQLSLVQTAQLLEMAKLDLRMVIHSISDEELRLFTLAVAENKARPPVGDSPALANFDLLTAKDRS
jgi:hypothetical protein